MSATLVLRGGRLLLRASTQTFVEALAVDGEQVIAAGDLNEVAEHIGPRTEVIDLAGRLAMPAFGDAHVHAANAGLEMLRCNLLGMRTRQACLDAVASYASGLAPGAWLVGGGWAMEGFPGGLPRASDLDAACGGRPAFLPNRDHHSAWVSSTALERAGIAADTPDPPDGRIERDSLGQPIGVLHEGAMSLVSRLVPETSPAELTRGLLRAQEHLLALGVTSWQDACIGDARELGVSDAYECYRSAAADGSLVADVVGALWWDRRRGLDQLPELLGRREMASEGTFRATTVKIMLDGVCETFTAAMSEPYVGRGPGHEHDRGELFIPPDEVVEVVGALDSAGFQVHFHALGDRAVHTALDALAALPPERRGLGRHHVAHLQFVAPGDLGRFRAVGAIANFQPLWACLDPQMEVLTLPHVGEERAEWQYSIASLQARGARLAFGSDWPVSSPDPLQEMHVAVNRRLSRRAGAVGTAETETAFRPDESVDLPTAAAAFTEGVAWINHQEVRRGSLEIGHRADLVILDQDLFAIPSSEIGDVSVDCTVVGGRVAYGDP